MTQTQLDIAFAIHWLSRQLISPTTGNLRAAMNLIRYLIRIKTYAISYRSTSELVEIGPNTLYGYVDSDYARCYSTGKSIYGYIFKINGGPISWKAKRATTIALSTLEAEYTALSEATCEILWYRGLFQELQQLISVPTVLKGDNQGSIETAYNPKHHNRIKHTLLKFQFVREQIVAKTVIIDYIPTI